MDVTEPVWADLAGPRAPTGDESRLLAAPSTAIDEPRPREQLAVEATARGPERQPVSLVLHVVQGRIGELEVFDTVQPHKAPRSFAVPFHRLVG